MKNLFIFFSLVLIGFSAFCQEIKKEQVPQNIIDRVNFEFPQAVDLPVIWSKEAGNYKAKLIIMEKPALMIVDSLGRTKRIERTINPQYLPSKATAYLKKLDPEHNIILATKIVDDKGVETYKLSVKVRTDFTFDNNGKVIGNK
jgi:hypothetical protein